MEQINFDHAPMQARAKAIKLAETVAGLPEDYTQTATVKGEPQQAEGIRGVLGATDSTGESTMTTNAYPHSLITIAHYIVTGDRY